jgi:DNA-directed RNA polymerase subunit K/omega
VDQETQVTASVPEPPKADEKYALNPTSARFLFVEIAAQRAKQLRRGALIRLAQAEPAAEPPVEPTVHKPERVAMEEVRQGFIQYSLPEELPGHPKVEGLL